MSEIIKKVVLLGPQGSGKSTQSKVIADYLSIKILSSSQILREVVAKDTPLGKKIKDMIHQGVLIPDEHVINLVLGEINDRCSNGFLLDGFPRNTVQAKALDGSCGVDKVFNIEISDQEAIHRISGRRICKNGHVYHLKFNPSAKGDVCEVCDGELYQRDDDKEETVARRLSIYREETTKLLDYYKKQDKLILFNGEKPIEEVSQDILKYLKKHAGQENS